MLCMKIVEGAIKSLTDRAVCWGEIWKIRKKEKKRKRKRIKKKRKEKKEKKKTLREDVRAKGKTSSL